jgi:putative transposase
VFSSFPPYAWWLKYPCALDLAFRLQFEHSAKFLKSNGTVSDEWACCPNCLTGPSKAFDKLRSEWADELAVHSGSLLKEHKLMQTPKAVSAGTGVIWQLRPCGGTTRRSQHAEEAALGRGDYFRAQAVYEGGEEAADICRKLGVSQATFYMWKKQYAGLCVQELRELRSLREENGRLKRIVADLTLDRQILREIVSKEL